MGWCRADGVALQAQMSTQLCNQWVMGHVMLCVPMMSSKYLQRAYGLEQIYKLVSNAAPPV